MIIQDGKTALELYISGVPKEEISRMILSRVKPDIVFQPERRDLFREFIKLNFMDSGVNVPNKVLKKIGYK